MGRAVEWVKDHPVLAAISAVVIVLLFFAFRRSSGGSGSGSVASSGPSESLQALGIQAGTQLQMYQTAAQVEMYKTDASLSALQLAAGVDLTKTQIAASYGMYGIDSQERMFKYGTDAQLLYGLAELGYLPGQPQVQPGTTAPAPTPVVTGSYQNTVPSYTVPSSYTGPQQYQIGGATYNYSPWTDPTAPYNSASCFTDFGTERACVLQKQAAITQYYADQGIAVTF